MTTFQLIGLPAVAALIVATLAALARRRVTRKIGAAWLLLWTAGGAALAMPDMTSVVAHVLGIQRGADLLLYTAVLMGAAGFLFIYLRFRRLDEQVTRLVRDIALLRAEKADERRTET